MAGDAADRQNNQADFGLEGFDTQNGKNPASTQNTGEGGFKQAQDVNNGPIVQDGSAETFGQIFGTQTDDGAEVQVSVDGQSEKQTKPTSENGTSDATMGVNSKTNKLPQNDAQLKHIFADRPGHIIDTPENRLLLERIANDKACYVGTDKRGCTWYALIREDGSQMKKCRRSSPQRKSQRFQCLHRNPDNTCRRTYEPCTESCRYFGTCGECVAYFIPAGQQPCRSCSKLNAGGR